MTRILLALLALLGLAVQAAPAEAAASCGVGSAEIGALPVSRSQIRPAAAQIERFVAPTSPEANLQRATASPLPIQSDFRAPTVLTGIDRARE
jgi:hypothetical protein